MEYGDKTVLEVRSYKCSQGTCANDENMFLTAQLYGWVECIEDSPVCVLDGAGSRLMITMYGSGDQTLTLRALTFKDGYGDNSGGAYIAENALVDIILCIFSNCRSINGQNGGGGIYVASFGGTVNIYATRFEGNSAATSGGDLYRKGGSINVHNTCPSPYNRRIPTKGKAITRNLSEAALFPEPVQKNPNKPSAITHTKMRLLPFSYPPGSALDTHGTILGYAYSYSDCEPDVWDMDEFFHMVSEDGNNIMANGGQAKIAAVTYTCIGIWHCTDYSMLRINGLFGAIICIDEAATCVLDGEQSRRGMDVGETCGQFSPLEH